MTEIPICVAVLLPLALDGPYSYLVPHDENEGKNVGVAPPPGTFVIVPLGPRQVLGVVWDRLSGPPPDPARLRPIHTIVDTPPMPENLRKYVDWLAKYTLSQPGMVLRMSMRVPEALEPEKTVTGYRLTGPPPGRMTPARGRVLEVAADGFARTRAELAQAGQTSASVINGLAAAGTLEAIDLPAMAPFVPLGEGDPPQLSDVQTSAAETLKTLVAEGGHKTVLLDGVTGSGKTEVYLEAVAQALRDGRQVLILLPEISLTAEFLRRFEARFKAPAAEWHSAMPRRERERVWRGVAAGKAQVVIGARSALWLPFRDLGLIVVDEEHEAAFKQGDGVVYHGRDMAVVRGALAGAVVVLASATPSLETFVNAERGKYVSLRLKTRHGGAALPQIEILDLRTHGPERGRWLAPGLVDAVNATVASGEQALLFLNRRGYAPLTLCRKCGYRFGCPQCDAWLVEHRFLRQLKCHHCGFAGPVPRACPDCGAAESLVACGPGVERIAEEVETVFPEARVLVLSSDSLGGVAAIKDAMETIRRGEVDIIVGTQLVAKGYHFPNLTLVGVVDADFGLAHGDPRSSERTYQLLHQVSGRAGREAKPGRAILQTHTPDHPVLQALVTGERDAFYARETETRSAAGLPPFGRLASVLISSTDKTDAKNLAASLARAIPAEAGIDVLGPAEAPIAVVRGRHRLRFLVRARRTAPLQGFLTRWLAQVKARGQQRIDVDVDPLNFL